MSPIWTGLLSTIILKEKYYLNEFIAALISVSGY
jgi:drug/metabolite transporter (DMT)-like permease